MPGRKGGVKGSRKPGKSQKELNAFIKNDLVKDIVKKLRTEAVRTRPRFDTPRPKGHKPDVFKRVIEADKIRRKLKIRSISAKEFNELYRRTQAGQDELLSTSTAREIFLGLLDEHKKNPFSSTQVELLNKISDAVSHVRLPTNLVGYSFSLTDVMQHPTSPNTGFFAPTQTASHSVHDTERKGEVVDAMAIEAKAPNSTVDSILKAGLRAAIAYTLNEMAAPITASDVKPFSRMSHVPDQTLVPYVQIRESLKETFERLGGRREPRDPQATPQQRLTRAFRSRHGARDASPSRF